MPGCTKYGTLMENSLNVLLNQEILSHFPLGHVLRGFRNDCSRSLNMVCSAIAESNHGTLFFFSLCQSATLLPQVSPSLGLLENSQPLWKVIMRRWRRERGRGSHKSNLVETPSRSSPNRYVPWLQRDLKLCIVSDKTYLLF